MDVIALHLEVRNALSLADELGRHEHAFGNDELAGHLAAMRTTLGELERELGRSHAYPGAPKPTLIERLQASLDLLRDRLEEIPPPLRPRVGQLMASLERVVFAELRPSVPVPAKPVLGKLPLRRVVPQAVHSVIDYVAALALLTSAKVARTRHARAVGLVLGAKLGGVALLTDSRMSAAKWLSVELHEVVDHGVGAGAVIAPFAFGYRKKDPLAAAIQIAAGVGTILASLFTDYRAEHGISRPIRSRSARRGPAHRVPEVQRRLEGFAAPSVLPRVDV